MTVSNRISTAIFSARGDELVACRIRLSEDDMRGLFEEHRDVVRTPCMFNMFMGVPLELSDEASELVTIRAGKIGRYEVPAMSRRPI